MAELDTPTQATPATMHIKTLEGVQQWRIEVEPGTDLELLLSGTAGIVEQIIQQDEDYTITDVVVSCRGKVWATTIYGERR